MSHPRVQVSSPIADQVVDFYYDLFGRIFSTPFRSRIGERLKRDAVVRQVEAAAGASSQSLSRFLKSQRLAGREVTRMLEGLAIAGELLTLQDLSNPHISPEAVVEGMLKKLTCPRTVSDAGHEPIYRVALHSVVQMLMMVGPVMVEWEKLNFSSSFELPRRVVNRVDLISRQIDALGEAGPGAADDDFELTYRDYLLQRFHRVEAGTVRMATNLDVDLREIFVMPRVAPCPAARTRAKAAGASRDLMDLAQARRFIGGRWEEGLVGDEKAAKSVAVSALEQLRTSPRTVLVGAPGSGKSTFLEWLQVRIAEAEEELVIADRQAIPLLLRVRQLDAGGLPQGAALIERATASRDRAALMPHGWIERQLKAGRVLMMLDGLDETEPSVVTERLLPWLRDLCQRYPKCHYVVSSRPVGYPSGLLTAAGFKECEILPFDKASVTEYARRWCTAIRLARNEPEEEARERGATDGDGIVRGFEGHPYIRNLAQNPLMLSAVCLVNYFEGGDLPTDRAVLYRLCVEGLLHHWDQRRGIRSDFPFDEKLRACREVALAMQIDDRAEYPLTRVQDVFTQVLGERSRAVSLLEHIRFRSGLLIERRPKIFAFAHLTFQEYLAARAVHDGNQQRVAPERLAREHADGRWNEVIALYCGLASTKASRGLITRLMAQDDSLSLIPILLDAYLSAGPELRRNSNVRDRVLRRALGPMSSNYTGEGYDLLERFAQKDVAAVANRLVGRNTGQGVTVAYYWLTSHLDQADQRSLDRRLRGWRQMHQEELSELMALAHGAGDDALLARLARNTALYRAPGSAIVSKTDGCQAELSLLGLAVRGVERRGRGYVAALLESLRALAAHRSRKDDGPAHAFQQLFEAASPLPIPDDAAIRHEMVDLIETLSSRLSRSSLFKTTDKAVSEWTSALRGDSRSKGRPRRRNTRMKNA